MFKFLEKVAEFFSMIKIALSPIIVFAILGIICYYGVKPPMGIVWSICSIVVGCVLGIWLAIYIHKKHGAIEFNSRISATPELDKKKEEVV
jgi:hypothetical protein